jgi:hypothetical protein
MEIFAVILFTATVVETVLNMVFNSLSTIGWDILNRFFNEDKLSVVKEKMIPCLKLACSIALSFGMTFTFKLDVLPELMKVEISKIGMIITALIISRGSNAVHDFISVIRTFKESKENL